MPSLLWPPPQPFALASAIPFATAVVITFSAAAVQVRHLPPGGARVAFATPKQVEQVVVVVCEHIDRGAVLPLQQLLAPPLRRRRYGGRERHRVRLERFLPALRGCRRRRRIDVLFQASTGNCSVGCHTCEVEQSSIVGQ